MTIQVSKQEIVMLHCAIENSIQVWIQSLKLQSNLDTIIFIGDYIKKLKELGATINKHISVEDRENVFPIAVTKTFIQPKRN